MAVVGLLAISVAAQLFICVMLFRLVEVRRGKVSIPVEITNRTVDVEVVNSSDIDVRMRNHWITGGDPIPVRIER
jgi:hypothetical protein